MDQTNKKQPIIQTHNLTKSYNDFTAVDHLNIEVFAGEVYGFLGPNGAGKTTTIKMLTTLLNPTTGNATLAGYDISKDRHDVRSNIGVVFQEPALDSELTGVENLDFHARMYNIPKDKRQERIKVLLELVELTDKKDEYVKNYSGGMKRRLEIARGLMHHPTILFLDEPTLGLDSQTRQRIWHYLETLNKEHRTTIFLTTHYMEEADILCDRISIIDQGKIITTDTPHALKKAISNDIIYLITDEPLRFKELLQNQTYVKTITQTETGSLQIGVQDGEQQIPKIFQLANEKELTIKSINLHQPTLDDVFIHYTGRTMRDESAENPFKPRMRMHNHHQHRRR